MHELSDLSYGKVPHLINMPVFHTSVDKEIKSKFDLSIEVWQIGLLNAGTYRGSD